jgi:hypothetical protein
LEEDAAMKQTDRRLGQGQSAGEQLRLPLRELVRETLFDTVMVAGLAYVGEVLEAARGAVCGLRYRLHQARGHYKTLRKKRRFSANWSAAFFWSEQFRGKPSAGPIRHRYKVNQFSSATLEL